MAEARSAVSIRVPPNLEEGRNSWKDLYVAFRKSIVRRYYRTRNSIRNGTWPTSTNNLISACAVSGALLLGEPEATKPVNRILWAFAEKLPLPSGTPRWLTATITSSVIGLTFFLTLMKVRQYILRALLSYRGWLYESLKSQSIRTIMWALLVRMISGYQPSLYSCQRSLPRLPVPTLRFTLEKLLESLEPLCDEAEMEELRREAETFERGLGSNLQHILTLKSWWAPNYVTDWWEKYVYLMTRNPLAINSNYYGLDCSYWTPTSHQTVRAATTLHNILVFKRLIDREELPPLVLRNTIPICMAQYERLFSTIRIPGEEIDELHHYDSTVSRHIVVNYLGFFYKVDCFDVRNQILSPASLQSQFDWIISDVDAKLVKMKVIAEANGDAPKIDEYLPSDVARSIASLTALNRTEWAKIYQEHFTSGDNRKCMRAIKTAILMVTLSPESPTDLTERGKKLIHNDGKSIWFDKCINVIYFKNGHCGLNVEHSFADAPVMGHAWEFTFTKEIIEKWYTDDGQCMPPTKSFRQSKYKLPHILNWEVNASLEKEIHAALLFATKNNEDLDLMILDHDEWGKGFIKKCKISPDAFIQIALQLAYYRDAGCFVQTYEASMTRLYLCGRTETVRSCTPEVTRFVKSLGDESYSMEEQLSLIKFASEKHQQLYRDAMNGMGIDRHLFSLYVLCKGLGYKSPFLEKILMRPWTLSTSQQPQQQLSNVPDANLPMFQNKVSPGGGFGPVSDDGYGISYMLPSDHKIFFHITSKHSCPKTSSKRFAQNIREAMKTLREFFEASMSESKKNN